MMIDDFLKDGVSVLETDQLAWLMSEGTIFRYFMYIFPNIYTIHLHLKGMIWKHKNYKFQWNV